MNKPCVYSGLALLAVLPCSRLAAADRVKHATGTQTGEITEISPTEIVVKLGATPKRFAVNVVDSVAFDAEPNDLAQARIAVRAGRYDDAVAMLAKIDVDEIKRAEIVQDIEFFKALAAARLALAGSGSKADAGRQLLAFEKAHGASFHYFEACEALGDLLAGLNKFDQAESYYAKLATAPWPDYKMRAGVLRGRALVGQKQYDLAAKQFDDVLAIDASGKDADRQKLGASLGKASALAAAGKTDEAIKSVEAIIAKADAENLELHARAYNILGNCYKAANKKKEALLAFLHVDLLYSRFPEQHAEALANLATLWSDVDKADRATQARNLLKEKYPNSTWAQQ
ncbi:MAG: tetratricopeptide repeat protein [Planctomycetia bacterium]|nr:tetratricopeptide repeat protein [Planctomycetia bacterium]